MDLHYYINTWRKFWNFMESLYPFLGKARNKASSAASRRLSRMRAGAFLNRRLSGRRGQAIKSVGEEFYWRDMTREREALAGLPPESLVVLRPVFLVSLALCFLLPFTLMFPYPAIAPSAISGAGGPVAGWSVGLWALTTALAWGCLLAGTGSANRPSGFLAAGLYLFIMAVTAPVGSKLNLIPVSTTLLAAAVCEHRMKRPGIRDRLAGLILCILIGMPCGVVLWKCLPPWSILKSTGLPVRMAFGGLLGIVIFFLSRTDDARRSVKTLSTLLLPLGRTVYAVTGLTLLFLTSLAFSIDFGAFADVLLRGEHYLTGFLWPVWYFIGVGIIFRLIRNSTTIVGAVRSLVRPSWFIPLTLVALAAALAVTLSYKLIMFGDPYSWPPWILKLAWEIYKATKQSIWQDPMYSFSLEPMTWVFIFDLLAVIWLAAKRMLNAERMASLLFFTLLAWFIFFEYYFESFSLARSHHHSMLILFLSSIWLLWFLHSIGLRVGTKSSPLWPATARLPAYGALLLFILLQFHARTAIRDFKVLNEIFYYLFRGIIDVGLPFVLYVYAGRRLGELPVPLTRLFAFFCLGGAITMPLAILDKLAYSHWSWPALQASIDAQYGQLMAGTLPPTGQAVSLPTDWLLARGAIVMVILFLAAMIVKKTRLGRPHSFAPVLFFVTSLAMGLAAFSNTLIALPFVPPRWELYYRPIHQSLLLDHDLLFLYLTYNIPALILVLSLTLPKGRFVLLPVAGVILAASIHLGLLLIWPAHSAILLSTGFADTMLVAGAAMFALLIHLARRGMDSARLPEPDSAVASAEPTTGLAGAPEIETGSVQPPSAPIRPVVGPTARVVFIVAGSLALCGIAFIQWNAARLDSKAQSTSSFLTDLFVPSSRYSLPAMELPDGFYFKKVPGFDGQLPLGASWLPLPSDKLPPDLKAMFIRREKGDWKPVLSIGLRADAGSNVRDLLGKLEEEVRKRSELNYERIRVEDWGHIFPGAVSEDFRMDQAMPDGRVFHLTATTVLLPQAGGTAGILTLACEAVDWEPLRAELVRTVELYSASRSAGKR
jgi:hypothetical protein